MRLVLASAIYPPEIGGPATITPLLAEAALQRGWDTEVIVYGDETTKMVPSGHLSVIPKRYPLPFRYGMFFWRVWRMARKSDVIFLQGSFAEGLPGMLAAQLIGCPVMVRMPGGFAWEKWQQKTGQLISREEFLESTQKRPWYVSLLSAMEGWVVRHSHRVFLPSRYLEPILAYWNVHPSRIRVIYNKPSPIQIASSKEEARHRLQLPADKRIFLTLARGIQTKRVDFLIRLLPRLPDAVLICLGDGEMYRSWRDEALRIGVGDRFLTPGRVSQEQVYLYARAADAFVLASHLENYPFAAVEMAMAGLPCFLSDRGGNVEAAENFPEHIQLLPYDAFDDWVEILRQPLPVLTPPMQARSPSMIDRYLDEIESSIQQR